MKQYPHMFSRRQILAGSIAINFWGALPQALAHTTNHSHIVNVDGLNAPIEICEDQWGIPHVQAETIADAFFANGYLIARDRLWQLDFEHRRSLGRLAEVFGNDFVESDIANRLFLFRGNLEVEFSTLPETVRTSAQAYVAGINAYIEILKHDKEIYPDEFKIFSYQPLKWDVLDLIRIRAEATGNTKAEIRRALLAAQDSLVYDSLIMPLRPAHELKLPDGLDVHAIRHEDLGLFATLQAGPPLSQAHSLSTLLKEDHRRANEGSNAWVISPNRTATGRPLLANDPHLQYGMPGPRYVIHLKAPGLDVIGAGSPGMPGIMQGHNAYYAFGRTNFHIDQEDLFILRTDPAHPNRYFHHGKWVEMEQEETTIAIRGQAPRKIMLRYAAQGPIISEDVTHQRAVAVAATWLYPGANGMLANIGINLAHDWNSFREALKIHTSPTNFTYADIQGNIGWQAAGGLPQRCAGYDGLMPAPGDGHYDWVGLQPLDALPNSFNPASGWFATSNELNLPPDYPYEERCVSYEWKDPYRYQRVAEVLQQTSQATIAQSVALQHDTLSRLALSVVALLPDVPTSLIAESRLLQQWDGKVEATSAAAALYEVWWTHLNRLFYHALIPEKLRTLIPSPLNASVLASFLKKPDNRIGPNPENARDSLLLQAFQQAVEEARMLLGPIMATWQWGHLHTLQLQHPLHTVKEIADSFHLIGGQTTYSGGDPYTVMARWYNADISDHVDLAKHNPYAVTGGASYLMVCDVGAWDQSVFLNFPGQSESSHSKHYDDFLHPWIKEDMQPLVFSPSAVQAATKSRTLLLPKPHKISK